MEAAGADILECYRVLGKSEANVVGEVLKGAGEFYEWDHYPTGDVYDWDSHSQYYYHAHPPENRANKWGAEHGHFHAFLRPKGMPKGTKPAPVVDFKKPKDPDDALTHLVAVSMNREGMPQRLFTTNRWVTGEVWYDAETVIGLLDRFSVDQALPSWPANIWITNMLRLFRPQIEVLLRRRDAAVHDWGIRFPKAECSVYEDRDLEVTSIVDISVERQLHSVQEALQARRR
ncbi:MAG: hypothetical protein COW30_14830 [Rhodospirillales bacterium CG15_BIG_FIL_POST_REV_8_21_14_020_66_15]|nr:MAG: hypothetical protein COW30_14830 [Rhodospirillales bacterium CG15_BIG_FIL_POST_REV_8_21_14_020_66_15]